MNWGVKVTILYGSFVLLMAVLVIGAMRQEWHMVTPDYYGKEQAYGEKQEKIARSRNLPERVAIDFVAADPAVVIQFPEDKWDAEGEILLFRPSDPNLDHTAQLTLNDLGQHKILASTLQPGLWRVEVDWKSGEETYFDARMVMVQ